MITMHQRFLGSMFGLAIGDALGAPVEFMKRGTFKPVKSFRSGGPFHLKAGEWTDDTSMALCLADSLIDHFGIDQIDQLQKYWGWYAHGRRSSTGRCFDIGANTLAALDRFVSTGMAMPGVAPSTSGNGSLMRLAPAVLTYHSNESHAIAAARLSSTTTHASDIVLDCVDVMTAAMLSALKGDGVPLYVGPVSYRSPEATDAFFSALVDGEPYPLIPSGYAIDSLLCALHAVRSTRDFKSAVLTAVNLGGDADTIGAITGQIAGAMYGIDGIPGVWVRNVAMPEAIRLVADDLYTLSKSSRLRAPSEPRKSA